MSRPEPLTEAVRQESDDRKINLAVQKLQDQGYAFIPDFLSPELTSSLRDEAARLHEQGHLKPAGIGRGGANHLPQNERRDSTLWWEEQDKTSARSEVYQKWSALREACNRALYLGLWDFEAHWAVYPPGGFYKRHLDRFRDDDARTLSAVLYLNPPDWRPEDGGELRIWAGLDPEAKILQFLPSGGALALFLSDRIPHEVCVTHRTRYSIAAWFRRRT